MQGKFVKQGELEAIQKEYEILQKLNTIEKNNNIRLFPKVYSFNQVGNCGILTMEKIDGVTLNDYKIKSKVQLVECMKAVARGLVILHTLRPSVIWCDCKPTNILVDNQNKIYLIDFDRALLLEYFRPMKCYGTMEYAAPEQKNGREIDGRTDIYGFGMTFQQMEIPFYWTKIKKLLKKCVELNPNDRFQTSGELLYELNQLI